MKSVPQGHSVLVLSIPFFNTTNMAVAPHFDVYNYQHHSLKGLMFCMVTYLNTIEAKYFGVMIND
jgi:hypothetical protein